MNVTNSLRFYFLFCFTLLNIATCATSSTDKYETLLLLLLTGILSPLLILECTNKADIYGESRTLELLISITFLSVNFYNLSPVLRVSEFLIPALIILGFETYNRIIHFKSWIAPTPFFPTSCNLVLRCTYIASDRTCFQYRFYSHQTWFYGYVHL